MTITANSRWLIMLISFRCRYSMGSSIVMIWALRLLFTASTTQAKVVDLPLPAGSVTSTMPHRWDSESAANNLLGHTLMVILPIDGRTLRTEPFLPSWQLPGLTSGHDLYGRISLLVWYKLRLILDCRQLVHSI